MDTREQERTGGEGRPTCTRGREATARRAPKSGADREKVRRQRVREGRIVLRTSVHHERFVWAALQLGLLSELDTQSRDSRDKLADLAGAVLDHWARSVLAKNP